MKGRVLFAACAVMLATACGSDPVSFSSLAGTWTATTFTTETNDVVTDVLAAGGSLSVTLTSGGAVSGQLHVPASVTGEGDLDASMAGNVVQQSGGAFRFNQSADTFVRNLDFSLSGSTLSASEDFEGTVVAVTLTRQ